MGSDFQAVGEDFNDRGVQVNPIIVDEGVDDGFPHGQRVIAFALFAIDWPNAGRRGVFNRKLFEDAVAGAENRAEAVFLVFD